ncbi:hypothetical protein ACQP2T_22875 [Nonomuraea sp. CA-143628]|uniref:hypothetical protein n=1 Tax=Nonomuraea sp. CA-143628 TaxID=3239997 RepID=UPI003D8B6268
MRPPKARTWSRRGHTPIVTVSGKGSGRVNLAGLLCVKPGRRTRLIFRMRIYRRRKHERQGFGESDYARIVDAAHQQLGGPVVLIWDNAGIHVYALMRSLIEARPWLTVFCLPAGLRARTQPGGDGVVAPQARPGQPGPLHSR